MGDLLVQASPPTDLLQGKSVAFAGRLATLTRSHAVELVADLGGRFCTRVTRDTALLVVGLNGWPLRRDGRVSGKLRKAQRLVEAGLPIEILREDQFLARLGLSHFGDSVCRRYTLDQVAKVAAVPPQRLRSWLRAGLLQPVETTHGVAQFDFRQISAVKRLQELTAAGVTPTRLRQSLRRLEAWLPDAQQWLSQLELFAQGPRLVARSADGQLLQMDGQRLFDFFDESPSEAPRPPALRFEPPASDADELFQQALKQEQQAEFAAAAAAYRQWLLAFGPDAQVCFNLGNTLFALGKHEAAAERYRQAVEVDPDYVEAWSNLGCVLAELHETPEAIAALTRATELSPTYPDALYNLADVLDRCGQRRQARRYWEAYLEQDADSPWAEHARSRLAAL